MTGLDEILAVARGARFFRADMHVHSYGGSHDVTDTDMTPTRIVETAVAHGLGVLSVTDHNEISNVAATVEAARGKPLLVIPGVELSTAQGHLLAYLPTVDALEQFHGRLSVADRGKPTSRCTNSIGDCLNQLETLGGFGILAHVDGASGFEVENPGGSPHKVDVLCHGALLGIELKHAQSVISYADGDPEPERLRAGRERIARLGLGEKQFLARVMFSDSHALRALGHNAAGDKKVTRIKMDVPSFAALRIALEDSDARVRIEELVPLRVPQILGASFQGGFLDQQGIHFSPNLNCIIGGRGTGKSTTFEALRCLSGSPSDNSVVDSEVWPGELLLFWRDAAGEAHSLHKQFGEPIANLDNDQYGPVSFPMECYGQGETTKLGQRAKADPLALLEYLDRFVDFGDAKQAEEVAREQLLTLQTEIEKSEMKVALIPKHERDLATTQQQLKASEKAKASEVIKLQRRLANEREIRARLSETWREAQLLIGDRSVQEKVKEIATLADPAEVTVGKSELERIVAAARELGKSIGDLAVTLDQHSVTFGSIVASELRAWKVKEDDAKREIETKRQELEIQGVKLDMSFIQKLAADEAQLKKSLDALNKWKPHLVDLRKKRAAVLKERWSARDRVATIRMAYGKQASETLRASLVDLHVSLKFESNACAPEAAALIQQVMGWRTNQVPRATLVTQKLTLPKLLAAIGRRDPRPLRELAFDDGTRPFDAQDAQDLIERLGEAKTRFALERCAVHDLPKLVVTKKVKRAGKEQHISREFSKLSLGQQQSILLTLLLSSDGDAPLIIDQPEDNLDGEFIYSSFVPVLRRAKERRQIIIITHNANIAVLGDAEQIVVLKVRGDSGIITARGSIDDPTTSQAACSILEGARAAFQRRAKIYGIR